MGITQYFKVLFVTFNQGFMINFRIFCVLRNFIDVCLKSINSNEEGKELIVFITEKLTENKCSVQIKAGNKQVFKTPKEGRPFTL